MRGLWRGITVWLSYLKGHCRCCVVNMWTRQQEGSCVVKYPVASSGFIKYVRICHLMWLSAELCDKFAIFHKFTVRNLGLKNLTKAGGWVTSWIQISCLQSLCSPLTHIRPQGLHELPQLKVIQLFMCGSQSISSVWFGVMRNRVTLTCGDGFSLKRSTAPKAGLPRVPLAMCRFVFSHLVWRLDIQNLKD